MISNPVINVRQYSHDFPQVEQCTKERVAKRCQSVFAASLPLISLIPGIKTPLSLGLSLLRNVNHLQSLISAIDAKNPSRIAIHSVQLSLSLAALALAISCLVLSHLNPSYSCIALGLDDLISNLQELSQAVKEGDKKRIAEILTQMSSTLLFISYITFGHIEILVTLMLIQIAFNLGKSADELLKGHYLESACYLAFSIVSIFQIVPQIKVTEWKWRRGGCIEGELCRDDRGFVYIKLKDEIVFELHEIFGDSLPPYFGEGKHGAHITVIPAGELSKHIKIDEIGKTFTFNIASFDSLYPDNFKGVEKVSFLALSSAELETFRAKYGLTAKVHGNHDFHITFSLKYKTLQGNTSFLEGLRN